MLTGILRDLRTLWRPANYHLHRSPPGSFEGWYFKFVDAAGQRRFAVIPGVYHGQDPAHSHAFVQTLDGVSGHTTYHQYPLPHFQADDRRFAVRIGPNRFSLDEIALDIRSAERRMAGVLRFTGQTPWPVTLLAPGIMGWYSFVPFMECYHGVLSLDHAVEGLLAVDGDALDFHGGRGYIEKDWGQAFPRAWVWMQSNHFEQPGVSLTASVARIPWLGSAFRGFIAGLLVDGLLYRFATYTGAQVDRLEVAHHAVKLALSGVVTPARHGVPVQPQALRLEITAHRADADVDLLRVPQRTGMLRRVLESLTARLEVRLLASAPGGTRTLFAGTGRHAGLELGGQLDQIL